MKRVVVSIDEDLYLKLKSLAEEEVRSVPNLLLWLAQAGLTTRKSK